MLVCAIIVFMTTKAYYDANRDKVLAYSREYQRTHKDKIRAYNVRYWSEHKETKEHREKRLAKYKQLSPTERQFRARVNRLNTRFGLTLAQYDEMLEAQKDVCAICGQPETLIHHRTKKIKSLSVDHNHTTGKVRQLLCNRCNTLVGWLEIDCSTVIKAFRYLKQHEKA